MKPVITLMIITFMVVIISLAAKQQEIQAQQCRTRVAVAQPYVAYQPYVAAVKVVAVQPVLLATYNYGYGYGYGVGYNNNYNNNQDTQIELLKLKLELEKIKLSVVQATRPNVIPSAPQVGLPQVGQAAQILAQKCGSCHDDSVAKAKGGGFVLSQGGQLLKLDLATQAKMMKEVYSGRMPKNGKLTDEEVGSIFGYLDSREK